MFHGCSLLSDKKSLKNWNLSNSNYDSIFINPNINLNNEYSNQNQQMQKIAYCLLNSGDDKVEDLALRLFNNDYSNINNI